MGGWGRGVRGSGVTWAAESLGGKTSRLQRLELDDEVSPVFIVPVVSPEPEIPRAAGRR